MYQTAAGTQREKAVPVILGLGFGRILTRIFEREASGRGRLLAPERRIRPKPSPRNRRTAGKSSRLRRPARLRGMLPKAGSRVSRCR